MERLQRGVDGDWRRVVQLNIGYSQDINTSIIGITAVLLFFWSLFFWSRCWPGLGPDRVLGAGAPVALCFRWK